MILRFFVLTIISFGPLFSKAADYINQQWGLLNQGQPQNIDIDPVTTFRVQARVGEDIGWVTRKGQKPVIVAVLDTGIDKNHPEFATKILRKESECRALEKYKLCLADKAKKTCDETWFNLQNPEVDLDKNGYPMDCSGWSILGGINSANIMGSPEFSDQQGHGTHVAGIIAANVADQKGVAGVSDNILILPVQVLGTKPTEPIKPLSIEFDKKLLNADEAGKESYRKTLGDLVARGVIYAINSGAQVINFSMGWPESNDSVFLREVIKEAQKRGVIIVAAAGNDSTRALLRPCAYEGVICVGAHGPDGSISHFSNYGTGVDLLAPGTNILSTFPRDKRSVRFRSELGYEYLHGTSQAAPFVAGVVAELLAQGVPADEIYPRLLSSSRVLQSKLPLLQGSPHDLREDTKPVGESVEPRYLLGGLVNLQGALTIKPQPLVIPATKDKLEVKWDLNSSELRLLFPLVNKWQEFSHEDLSLDLAYFNLAAKAIRPKIVSYRLLNDSKVWKNSEVKTLEVKLLIDDQADPSDSRIASDLDFDLRIIIKNNLQRLVLEAEIIVPVEPEVLSDKHETYQFLDLPQDRFSLVAIDENLDDVGQTDYLAIIPNPPNRMIYDLYKLDGATYKKNGRLRINGIENLESFREQFLQRLPKANASDEATYVLGVLFDNSDSESQYSKLQINYLDSSFKLENRFEITNEKVQLPSKIYWQKLNGRHSPVWSGRGYRTDKKPSLRDAWENPNQIEKPDNRIYFIDLENNLKSISSYEGYSILDIIEPNSAQIKSGRIPVLLGKNKGSKNKPSYLFEFAIVELSDGILSNFIKIGDNIDQKIYRNLLESRVDKVQSLDKTKGSSVGTFWFSEGADKTQRVSVLLPNEDYSSFKYFDKNLPALRGNVDATLWVRSVFYGNGLLGAFALSNTEIQFHDLISGQAIGRSLERYTFYSDYVFTNLHFPINIRQRGHSEDLPALFTTESSGLSRGFKLKMPVKDKNNDWIEIMSPAKLRFKSGRGCKPLDNPAVTREGIAALDYFCGDRIYRIKLEY